MDDYSRRATIESVREHQTEGALTSDWAISVLDQYDDLEHMAQEVAKVVWSMRWPRSYEPSFEISFSEEFRDGRRAISASYYMHSSNDSFEFPFGYLFMDFDQIQACEDIRKDEEHAKQQAERERIAAERQRSEIAQLKRLREQYPDA